MSAFADGRRMLRRPQPVRHVHLWPLQARLLDRQPSPSLLNAGVSNIARQCICGGASHHHTLDTPSCTDVDPRGGQVWRRSGRGKPIDGAQRVRQSPGGRARIGRDQCRCSVRVIQRPEPSQLERAAVPARLRSHSSNAQAGHANDGCEQQPSLQIIPERWTSTLNGCKRQILKTDSEECGRLTGCL